MLSDSTHIGKKNWSNARARVRTMQSIVSVNAVKAKSSDAKDTKVPKGRSPILGNAKSTADFVVESAALARVAMTDLADSAEKRAGGLPAGAGGSAMVLK
mmetsp:Transcript_124238/g.362684  ORF Transcript_124238/g.362684 Transcript_124238/m.362684 type:complete len:100 (-) Transcript_124238:178-477(-)